MEYTLDLPPSLIERFAAMGFPDPLDGLHHAAKLFLNLGPAGWDTITAAADAAELAPSKFILAAVQTHTNPTPTPEHSDSPESTPAIKPKRRNSNEARDAQISSEYLAGGITYPKLAAKYGLSVVRVVQIVAKARATQGL